MACSGMNYTLLPLPLHRRGDAEHLALFTKHKAVASRKSSYFCYACKPAPILSEDKCYNRLDSRVGLQYGETDTEIPIIGLSLVLKLFFNYCLHTTAYTHFRVVVNQPLQERVLVHVTVWV